MSLRGANESTAFEAGVALACFDERSFTLLEKASPFSMMLIRIVVRYRFYVSPSTAAAGRRTKVAPSVQTRAAGTRRVAVPKERSEPRRCPDFIFPNGLARPMPLVGVWVHSCPTSAA